MKSTKTCETEISAGNLPKGDLDQPKLKGILSIVFSIIGALAVLMLVISGFRYVLSAGDSDRISRAKNGIIYALVGLLVAITAQAIVVFVVEGL